MDRSPMVRDGGSRESPIDPCAGHVQLDISTPRLCLLHAFVPLPRALREAVTVRRTYNLWPYAPTPTVARLARIGKGAQTAHRPKLPLAACRGRPVHGDVSSRGEVEDRRRPGPATA